MFVNTRLIAQLPQIEQFYGRAIIPDNTHPNHQCGGAEGLAELADIGSSLRGISTHLTASQTCVDELRDCASFVPLLYKWQQDDFRPLFYTDDSRQLTKDATRTGTLRPCEGRTDPRSMPVPCQSQLVRPVTFKAI